MRSIAISAAALALVSQSALAQDNTVRLEPSSPWVLDYAEDSCALRRQFGEEGGQANLELRQFGHNRDLQVMVYSSDFERKAGLFAVKLDPLWPVPVTMAGFDLKLGPDTDGKLFTTPLSTTDPEADAAARAFVEDTWLLTDEQRELVLSGFGLNPAEDTRQINRLMRDRDYQIGVQRFRNGFRRTDAHAQYVERAERAMEGILVNQAFEVPLYFETGSMRAPMDAMRECLDELITHWGIDVEAHRTLSFDAEPVDWEHIVREMQEDYPRRMIRERMQGLLQVRLDVSAEGEPTACHMQSPINDEEFEEIACANLMRFARFNPALDAAGQPVASYYQTTIIYVMQ